MFIPDPSGLRVVQTAPPAREIPGRLPLAVRSPNTSSKKFYARRGGFFMDPVVIFMIIGVIGIVYASIMFFKNRGK